MEKKLFDAFDPVSAKAWKQKIQFDLKGRDYNEHLVWESPEGINVKPFYHADDFENGQRKPTDRPLSWRIAQQIYVADAVKANEKANAILRCGIESLMFTVPSEEIELKLLLSGLHPKTVPVYFNFGFLSRDYLKNLPAIVGEGVENIHLNVDPIGNLARTGNWFFNSDKDFGMLNEILASGKESRIKHMLSIDACLYQNAGANSVQQLAYALAHANEYLNRFNQGSPAKVTFKIAVGGNYFFEIAKVRALRKLWKTLAAEYGLLGECHIMAIPSQRNKTLYEYNANLLRSTTECMSAILGGADAVCNLSYDAIYHKSNEFAERMARNQLLMLKEESYFDGIANPASGAYYIESLTHQLAEKALVLFKDIEENGGFLNQLKNQTIQRKIKESAHKEQRLFDTGKAILVGTNAYQNKTDVMKNDIELYPFVKKERRKTLIEPIIERRLSEDIERSRLMAEGWR